MFRRARCFGRLLAIIVGFALGPGWLWAQEESGDDDWLPEKREEQLQDLAREVAELEKLSRRAEKSGSAGPADGRPHRGRQARHRAAEARRQQPDRRGRQRVHHSARENYYVLTNCHVVRQATLRDIKIRLADGRQVHPLEGLARSGNRRGRDGDLGAEPGRLAAGQ